MKKIEIACSFTIVECALNMDGFKIKGTGLSTINKIPIIM